MRASCASWTVSETLSGSTGTSRVRAGPRRPVMPQHHVAQDFALRLRVEQRAHLEELLG
jgi:hypothetical protein